MNKKTKIWLGMGAALVVVAALAIPDPAKKPATKVATVAVKAPTITDIHPSRPGNFFAMVADPKMPAHDYLKAAQDHCRGKQFCSVMGWTDAGAAATAMPMLDREVAAQVFHYSLNRPTGNEQALWNCKVFPSIKADKCLATD